MAAAEQRISAHHSTAGRRDCRRVGTTFVQMAPRSRYTCSRSRSAAEPKPRPEIYEACNGYWCGWVHRLAPYQVSPETGTSKDRLEKAPAALCRKNCDCKADWKFEKSRSGVTGNRQGPSAMSKTLSPKFTVMRSECPEPLNVGDSRLVTVDRLVDIIAAEAGVQIRKKYMLGPQGVRGRNSDNGKTRSWSEWFPQISLENGPANTCAWIEEQVRLDLSRQSSRQGRAEGVIR